MFNRSDVNSDTTNDELARRLFQRDNRVAPPAKRQIPEPLASRREPNEAPQTWTLGPNLDAVLKPVSERERRALFVALSKGTKANLGREPTVSELAFLIDAVDQARGLVSSTQDAIQGRANVYLEDGKVTFRGSIQ